MNLQQKEESNENIVLFSAKVNIESPSDLFNDSFLTDNEDEWKEYLFKKYFHDRGKTIIIQERRSLLSDIMRTIVILIIFAFVLIIFMLISLMIYKRLQFIKRNQTNKRQPFPADDAYDNLKISPTRSIADSGTITDV
ncbi:unnamed protein product [Rotaria sordida]|uniref:Uncharacterized protein n=1 Tax=Rotaria sordida TaxID=392033 RepID=A0A816AS29_9BILA|nr:unnamed protein product [Rotaria sordida]CAF1599367.1 unnamed protein product [Rotaria sordida]